MGSIQEYLKISHSKSEKNLFVIIQEHTESSLDLQQELCELITLPFI